jgi:hypothetical protein
MGIEITYKGIISIITGFTCAADVTEWLWKQASNTLPEGGDVMNAEMETIGRWDRGGFLPFVTIDA